MDSADRVGTNNVQEIMGCFFIIMSSFAIGVLSSSFLALIPILVTVILNCLIFKYYFKTQRSLIKLVKMSVSPVIGGLT